MRNPNGYGNISKLPGNRRKPYRVRITERWDIIEGEEKLKQIYKPIGYYKTRPEAMRALAEYHKDPNHIEISSITFAEIYDKWSTEKFCKTSKSSVGGYTAAYKLSGLLYAMAFVSIRKIHLQDVVDKCGRGHGTRKKIKVLFNQLYKYALENDIVNKDYSQFVNIGVNDSESNREPFTTEEIKILFDNENRMEYIDTALIMIYTGMRVGEMLEIKIANIDLENRTMKGGLKTAAGKNRIIPINKKILPYIEKRCKAGKEYLIENSKKKKMDYWTYKDSYFLNVMEQLKMKHLPHDCRHTFATLMDNAGANKVSIKRIMGHASKDITDKVYTHKDIDELKKAIDML